MRFLLDWMALSETLTNLYFWWNGWDIRNGMFHSYHKGDIAVYPPTYSRNWVVICWRCDDTKTYNKLSEIPHVR